MSNKKQNKKSGLIAVFVDHPTAANLLMALMLMAGFFSISKINTQFFPSFDLPMITVNIAWPGASAEDISTNILESLEPSLRYLDDLDNVTSVAREGIGTIALEFNNNADMQQAIANVQQAVDAVTTLPEEAEDPVITRRAFYENVGRLSITGPFSEKVVKNYARKIRDGLLRAGIDRVELNGARKEEIEITLKEADLRRLKLTLADIAAKVKLNTTDRPSGTLEGETEMQLRTLSVGKTPKELGLIEIRANKNGEKILLRDVATIAWAFDDNDILGMQHGQPAIELKISRAKTADTLKTLKVLKDYLKDVKPTLPQTLEMKLYNVTGELVTGRLKVLVVNGIEGLAIVLIVLFIFLNMRIAFWVAMGIPVAIMATLAVMYLSGQSVNMISMFAIIMMMGIIVDDAIVVGEHTATRKSLGDSNFTAANIGAGRMFTPVLAATLTTQAAFLPILLISGRMGDIMGAIPLVVMAVLVASLIECFLILPGHLRHGLRNMKDKPSYFRGKFDGAMDWFRDHPYRAMVSTCYRWRYTTVALTIASFIIAIGMISGGRISIRFFPSPESERMMGYVTFAPGVPKQNQANVMKRIEDLLVDVEKKMNQGLVKQGKPEEKLVVSSFSQLGKAGKTKGENKAQIFVQLSASEVRSVPTKKIMKVWRKMIPLMAGVESVSVTKSRRGPSGNDIDIRLQDAPITVLKQAALEVREKLTEFPGLTAIDDDLPYGKKELVLSVSPRGQALGFTAASLGSQVRDAFQGKIATRFAQGDDEITVRVRRQQEKQGIKSLYSLYLNAPDGTQVPMSAVVNITEKSGFSLIQRKEGLKTVSVTADVNEKLIEVAQVVERLEREVMPHLVAKYGIKYSFSGQSEQRAKAFADLKLGAYVSLATIFIILAWVFKGYSYPLAVMLIIPFGFVGTVFGHMIMGQNLSIISFIGLLGLSGILVNDSIILVTEYQERRSQGQDVAQSAIGASQDRFRAVLLTSLTTIGGLLPLLFETSRQAQFLIPMAITMVFGLAAATILVLVLVPALLGIGTDLNRIGNAIYRAYWPYGEVEKA